MQLPDNSLGHFPSIEFVPTKSFDDGGWRTHVPAWSPRPRPRTWVIFAWGVYLWKTVQVMEAARPRDGSKW